MENRCGKKHTFIGKTVTWKKNFEYLVLKVVKDQLYKSLRPLDFKISQVHEVDKVVAYEALSDTSLSWNFLIETKNYLQNYLTNCRE